MVENVFVIVILIIYIYMISGSGSGYVYLLSKSREYFEYLIVFTLLAVTSIYVAYTSHITVFQPVFVIKEAYNFIEKICKND